MSTWFAKGLASLVCCGALVFGAGCEGLDGEEGLPKDQLGKADSSNQATILNFEFDGELVTDSVWGTPNTVIQDQLLYTIGHLNGNRSVGRLDKVTLTNIKQERQADGKTKVSYRAAMPVSWGSKTNLPSTYGFRLPRDVSRAGQDAFTAKYKDACVDWGAHDVDVGSMWYYYRPAASACRLADSDVIATTATVSYSPTNTTGRYPEYHKVWEDGELRVVAIFGKYEDGATSTGDAGIAAFNEFVGRVKTTFAAKGLATVPAEVPSNPGPKLSDVSFTATLDPTHKLSITAILVDSITNVPPGFDARYADLSTKADLIAYNGHAGLGQNVRALARKGRWTAGQYLMLFMNGCDTYAYVDGHLAQTRAAINADDPTGSKYLDIVTNAMPSFFASTAEASMALINGLLSYGQPRTYERIFAEIDTSQIVLVSGEEDNVYNPGMSTGSVGGSTGPTAPASWGGLRETGSVARSAEKRYETPKLEPGKYLFELTGTGDADLYVRTGAAPSTSTWECRPYLSSSKERCTLDLKTASSVHLMVRGYAANSTFTVAGRRQ